MSEAIDDMIDSKIRVLISEEEIEKRVMELGAQITKDYAGKELHMICVLKGGAFFLCELARRVDLHVSVDFMSVSSYGNATVSSGAVRLIKDLDESIEGKDVLIVEDIIDSGNTLKYLMDILSKRNPASLRLCTLLNKPSRRQVPIDVDYTGFVIPDAFVVGYGLDYKNFYRNLPYVGCVDLD